MLALLRVFEASATILTGSLLSCSTYAFNDHESERPVT